MALELYATPLSHFSRKVRILLGHLGVQYRTVWVSSVMATDTAAFADNPLMRVPTLVVGDRMLVDSDHIARYIVATYDPSDWFGVRSDDPSALNRLAIANGIMANEVVLILAKRGGVENLESVAYFRKLLQAIDSGLAWLDANIVADAPMTYADIALICMWDHLRYYAIMVTGLERYPRIAARVAHFAQQPAVASTAPEAALAEATAAGWQAPS